MEVMDANDALRSLGKYSRWQVQTYAIYGLCFGFCFGWMMMTVVFLADMVPHRCKLPDNATVNDSIPMEWSSYYNKEVRSSCSMYLHPGSGNNTTIACPNGYEYDFAAAGYESTVVTEYDLVCDKAWLMEFSMTIQGVGNVCGIILWTRLSDIWGRRSVLMLSSGVSCIFQVIQSFSVNYWMYLAFNFLAAFQRSGIAISSMVLLIEIFPVEQRTTAGVAIEFFWVLGYASLAPLAYAIRNWRYLLLATSAPMLVTVLCFPITDESVPWLIAQKRYFEATKILQKAARMSRRTFTGELINVKKTEEKLLTKKEKEGEEEREQKEETPTVRVQQLCSHPKLRCYTIVLTIIWVINVFCYVTLTLNVTFMKGNRYLNFFLYALVELPGYTICWISIYKLGRIRPLAALHLTYTAAILCSIVTHFDIASHLPWLETALMLVAKFAISASWATIYVNVTEVFPTNIRTSGVGVVNFIGRVASFVGPYTRILARTHPWANAVIGGSLSALAACIAFALPETRWTKLPETVEEVASWKLLNFKKPEKKDKPEDIPLQDLEQYKT